MGLIQRADLVERIRRAFGIREPGVGATMSPEIVPVVLVEDLTGPTIDVGYPRLCMGKAIAGASVGLMAETFLINPPGSQLDIIVQEIWTRPGANMDVYFRFGAQADLNNLLGTNIQRFNFDLRVQQFPGFTVDTRNQAASIGSVLIQIYQTSTWTIYPMQFTIPPGRWISQHPASNNTEMRTVYFGYERLRTTT